jgi:hypothetical protein
MKQTGADWLTLTETLPHVWCEENQVVDDYVDVLYVCMCVYADV